MFQFNEVIIAVIRMILIVLILFQWRNVVVYFIILLFNSFMVQQKL